MSSRDEYRRSLDAVHGPHRSADRRSRGADESDVRPLAADPGVDAGREEARAAGRSQKKTSTPESRKSSRSRRSRRAVGCSVPAWPAAPLPSLSIAQTTIVRPVSRSGTRRALGRCPVLDAREPGTTPSGRTLTSALGIRLVEQRAQVGTRRTDVAGRDQSTSDRQRCGTNVTANPSRAAISGACRCSPTLYGVRFSSTEPACELGRSDRPAPRHAGLRIDHDRFGIDVAAQRA